MKDAVSYSLKRNAGFDRRWPLGIVKDMNAPLVFGTLLTLCSSVTGIAATESSAEIVLLGGTVVSIDQESSFLTLRMPSGESRVFATVDRRLLQNLATGDHVTYELNEAGKIIRLVKLPTDPAN